VVPIDHFDTAAEQSPDTVAIVDGDLSLTFAQVAVISRRIAALLAGVAVPVAAEQLRVVVYSPNDYRVFLTAIGIMRAGGAIVPVHAANPVEITQRFLATVRPHCAVYHSSLEPQVNELRATLPGVAQWWCLDAPGCFSDAFGPDAPAAGADNDASWIDPCGNRGRPVYYWPTSGTTGEPKVVIDDISSFEGTMLLIREVYKRDPTPPVTLALGPLSHSTGAHGFAILTLGGTVIVMRRFDAGAALDAIERYRVSDIWLSPTALYLLLERPDIRRRDLTSVRHVTLGMAAVAATRLRDAVDVFGPCISQSYGQIETGFVTALDAATTAAAARGTCPERLMSAGRSLFVNRIAIMSDEGRLMPPGEPGEIVVRGRCVKRYLDDETTADARRFGWHHTGDLGYLDEEGYLYIVGRRRDVVNMAGLKVPALEIEGVLMELPAVRECAVIATADPIRGEVATAVVALKAGCSIAPDAVLAHCRRRLGTLRTPVSVHQWADLPKSPAGKVDKRRVREALASARPTGVPHAG
jgi:fatty-acyl-CoA synthase